MSNVLSRIFSLDAYTDPAAQRRAANLYGIVLVTLVISISGAVGRALSNNEGLAPANLILIVYVIALASLLYLIRRGQEHIAGNVFIATALSMTAWSIASVNDLQVTPVLGIVFVAIIAISGLVSRKRDVIALTGYAVVLYGLGLILGIELQDPVFGDQTVVLIAYGSLVILSGVFAWVIANDLDLVNQIAAMSATERSLFLNRTTTDIAQRILTQTDLEDLLTATVENIRAGFEDIYHAQVFLIDERGQNAILRASTGEVGQSLIARGHYLAVGSTSVIGQVTQRNDYVLAEDASTDAVHRANELLPETLTELALPLRSREGVIGALDVQSTKRGAFSTDDVTILQTLADQIAIAVGNARLLDTARREAERARALAEAGQITSRISVDFERGLKDLFETIAVPGGYSHWWLGLLQTDGRHLRSITSQASPQTGLLIPYEFDLETDQNTIVQSFNVQQTVIVNDATSPNALPTGLQDTFGKHLATPIYGPDGQQQLGTLLVGREKDAPDLSEQDVNLALALSNQISIALENQRLFTELANEQATLQSILDTIAVSVVVVDPQGKITLTNERSQGFWGRVLAVGEDFHAANRIYRTGTNDLYPSHDLPINVALQRRELHIAEDMTLQRPDGMQIDMLAQAAPILNPRDKSVTSIVAVYQDITELRELERALQESLSETTRLYEASRSISHASTMPQISEAVANQMLSLSPSQIYITLKSPNSEGESLSEIELTYAWPPQPEKSVADLALPYPVVMPDLGTGTTNLTFATANLHALPGITEDDIAALEARGIYSLTVLPLEVRGEVYGAIIGIFDEKRHFSPEERRFLLTLADQTAVAVDAVRSFQKTQATLQSISKLYSASRTIAEQQDIDQVLSIVQDYIMEMEPISVEVLLAGDQENPDAELREALIWSRDGSTAGRILAPLQEQFDLLSGASYFIEDVDQPLAEHADLCTALRQSDPTYRAVVSIPFAAAGQPTGRLSIGFDSPRKFDQDNQQFLRMLADSTAYIIENDILFRQTQDSLEETGILYQAIRAFANADDQEGILQAIIDYAADPAVDKAMLCLLLTESWDSPNALMEVVVSWMRKDSVDLTGMRFTAEQFPSWEQISTQKILWVDNVMQHDLLDETARMGYRALDIGSFVIVPLRIGTRAQGAILLGSTDPRQHTEREIRIYQSLADQAAITLENKRLYDETEQRARQLATSARVSRAASSILQLEELMPEMVDLIKEAFGYDQVQIFLLSDSGKDAILRASTGEAGQQLLSIQHSLPVGSRSVIGTVTETGKPSIALDTADARVIHKPNPYLPNTRSEMAIPLISRGKILGALDVQSNQPGAFTEGDVRVLTVLADQLAVAIENASLFEVSQRRTEEMGFLFTITAESTTSGDLRDILNRVVELLLDQLTANLAMAYLFEEEPQELVVGGVASTEAAWRDLAQYPVLPLDSDDIVANVGRSSIPAMLQDTSSAQTQQTRHPSLQSGIYMPLITSDSFIGVLVLESEHPNQFDDSTLALLQAMTGSLSAVVQNTRLLDDIRAANERLREVDKLKTNFLAAMSHELRTPLNSIIGFSRVILKGIDGPITEQQEQDLQTIHDSGKHLLGLVNDILDQAKIEAGKMELSRKYFDMVEVINGVMASAVGLTKEKPIRLNTEIETDLPMVYGDEFRSRQVLFNLISNAAKFTREGSITTSATRITDGPYEFVRISVTDTGVGISEKDFPMLFESFQQVDNSTTREAEGTGLGLPLAKSLAELQGGRIWVESEVGLGSTFSFTIPIQPYEDLLPELEAEAEELSHTQQSEADAALPSEPRPMKAIIMVDDNIDIINGFRRNLNQEGYDITGVTKLDDLDTMLMKLQPVAIVLKLEMEADGGWRLLEQLADHPIASQVPIIATSQSPNGDAERSRQSGATVHLTRPFTPQALVHAIQNNAPTPSE
ncbi:MAG: GAF domain-containing protein [Anaerolineales bacterium]